MFVFRVGQESMEDCANPGASEHRLLNNSGIGDRGVVLSPRNAPRHMPAAAARGRRVHFGDVDGCDGRHGGGGSGGAPAAAVAGRGYGVP